VVAGITSLQPFDRWSTRTVERGSDVTRACEEAATAPLPEHGKVSRQAARQVLATAGRGADAETSVWRRGGGLRAEIRIPAGCADLTGMIAARVAGALRQFDAFAAAIDVSVAEASIEPTPEGQGAVG
jgi:hypothetical protein